MTHGVIINGNDLLSSYGLILLSDVSISSPKLREQRVTVAGRSGTLNMSYALTGAPIYDDISIKFTLFKSVDDATLLALRDTLAQYHGREVDIMFPWDTSHFYRGVLQLGALSGYNSGKIPVTMTAEPYRYETVTTVVANTIGTTATAVTLTGSAMPVLPVFRADVDTTITCDGDTYAITADTDYTNNNLILAADGLTFEAVGASAGTLTVTYIKGELG